jgi:hypothetical protein
MPTSKGYTTWPNFMQYGNDGSSSYGSGGSPTGPAGDVDLTGFAPLASPEFTGNISIGSGLISNSIVSVGTTWVDVPNTQPRGHI